DFEWISDLATVTMIGEDPENVDGHNRCSAELQKSRLDYLKELANGRRIPQKREIERTELAGTTFDKVFSGAVEDFANRLKNGEYKDGLSSK
ncbi:MAG: hypothetical protein K5784_08460, partial [Clostridiales bacterium]|nr:hypothetical protein [Clostridiales bacterium]